MLGNNWCNKRYFNRKNIPRTRLESLKFRRWFRKLYHLYKIFKEKSPSYLFKLRLDFNSIHNTRLNYNNPPIKVRHDYFKNSVFPSPISWRCGVVVITTAQLHSTKPELRFCAGSNPARGVSEIRDGEDPWQWSRLEIKLNAFRRSTIPQKQFIIIHHHHIRVGQA